MAGDDNEKLKEEYYRLHPDRKMENKPDKTCSTCGQIGNCPRPHDKVYRQSCDKWQPKSVENKIPEKMPLVSNFSANIQQRDADQKWHEAKHAEWQQEEADKIDKIARLFEATAENQEGIVELSRLAAQLRNGTEKNKTALE